jgi:hypothetical protein
MEVIVKPRTLARTTLVLDSELREFTFQVLCRADRGQVAAEAAAIATEFSKLHIDIRCPAIRFHHSAGFRQMTDKCGEPPCAASSAQGAVAGGAGPVFRRFARYLAAFARSTGTHGTHSA